MPLRWLWALLALLLASVVLNSAPAVAGAADTLDTLDEEDADAQGDEEEEEEEEEEGEELEEDDEDEGGDDEGGGEEDDGRMPLCMMMASYLGQGVLRGDMNDHAVKQMKDILKVEEMPPPRKTVVMSKFWRMALICMDQLTEREAAEAKAGNMQDLPGRIIEMSRLNNKEGTKIVLAAEKTTWEEIQGICASVLTSMYEKGAIELDPNEQQASGDDQDEDEEVEETEQMRPSGREPREDSTDL